MSAYNTVSARLTCPNCGAEVLVSVQFKFGNTWQFHYHVGDRLQWRGNDIGKPGNRRLVVDGVVADSCPQCGYDAEWNVYVYVEGDRVTSIQNATGEFDFVRYQSNYIVIE